MHYAAEVLLGLLAGEEGVVVEDPGVDEGVADAGGSDFLVAFLSEARESVR